MPNIDPQVISKLVFYMSKNKCDIGTLASDLRTKDEITNPNVVKVAVKERLEDNTFLSALDFLEIKIKLFIIYIIILVFMLLLVMRLKNMLILKDLNLA